MNPFLSIILIFIYSLSYSDEILKKGTCLVHDSNTWKNTQETSKNQDVVIEITGSSPKNQIYEAELFSPTQRSWRMFPIELVFAAKSQYQVVSCPSSLPKIDNKNLVVH